MWFCCVVCSVSLPHDPLTFSKICCLRVNLPLPTPKKCKLTWQTAEMVHMCIYVHMKDSVASEAGVTLPNLSLMPRGHLNSRTCIIVNMASLRSVKNLNEGFGLPPIGHRIEDKISFFKKKSSIGPRCFYLLPIFLLPFTANLLIDLSAVVVSMACTSFTSPLQPLPLSLPVSPFSRECLSRSTMSPILLNLILSL